MQLTLLTLTLSSLFASHLTKANPTLIIRNTNPYTLCFKVETSTGTFPTTTVCNGTPGINVAPMTSSTFYPSSSFNGAITLVRKRVLGTRFEINFSDPAGTWYDADMELGMSAGTLGPLDHRPRPNGQPSLAGEQDPLAKANAAWPFVSDKAALLKGNERYLTLGEDGMLLTRVYFDKQAGEDVQSFFQLEAGFNAYLGYGSVEGWAPERGSRKAKLVKAQDEKAWFVGTSEMVMVIY